MKTQKRTYAEDFYAQFTQQIWVHTFCRVVLHMTNDIGIRFIHRFCKYVEPPPLGLHYYEQWVADEEEVSPGVSELIRSAALELIRSKDSLSARSAIHALACTGVKEDIPELIEIKGSSQDWMWREVEAAIAQIDLRSKSLETLLEEVCDQRSFVIFARALAKEREKAQKIEDSDADRYRLNGAMGWNNGDIASFIYSGLSIFENDENRPASWADFARFLCVGKELE